MSKWFLIIVFIILGIFGVIFYSSRQPMAQPEIPIKKVQPSTSIGQEMAQARYVEYSKGELDNAVDKRRVLFFYANWCPTCRPTDANFSENENKIPEDVVVIRVNYNDTDTDQEEKDLAQRYGITYQHTFVQIDADGKKIAVWNGGQLNELLNNIK